MSRPWWPAWALATVAFVLARGFTPTPELSAAAKKNPTAADVAAIHDDRVGAIVGAGLTWLGLACLVVFAVSLARAARAGGRESIAPALIVVGGAITAAVVMLGFALLFALGAALIEDYAVSSVAAIDALGTSIGYNGWVAIGLVTAGVALAGLRDRTLPAWLGWVSAVATVLFAALTFFPVVAWLPALLWLLVAGVGLLLRPPRPA